MPLNTYRCQNCGKEIDVVQWITEQHIPPRCPNGKDHVMEKQFGTGIGLRFKGSGFYATDYKAKGK